MLLGVAGWLAPNESGVEPVVLGLLVGARPAGRPALHRVAERFRRFRELPPLDELRDRAALRAGNQA